MAGIAPNPLPVDPIWFHVPIASPTGVGVDRQNKILRGYVVAQEGQFKSEGRGAFDSDSLERIAAIINAKPKGIKARFTHPTISDDGLGKFLGRSRDARIEELEIGGRKIKAVRADLHFDSTAFSTPPAGGRPLAEYVMELAENDPDAFSSSLVLQADHLHPETHATLSEGEAIEQNITPIWRPTVIHASDIVDTGDAVDGILSTAGTSGGPTSALWRGAELLDQVFKDSPPDVVRTRVEAYLNRYLSFRNPEIKQHSNLKAEVKPMPEEIENLQTQIDSLKEKLETLSGERDFYKGEHEALAGKYNDLQGKFDLAEVEKVFDSDLRLKIKTDERQKRIDHALKLKRNGMEAEYLEYVDALKARPDVINLKVVAGQVSNEMESNDEPATRVEAINRFAAENNLKLNSYETAQEAEAGALKKWPALFAKKSGVK